MISCWRCKGWGRWLARTCAPLFGMLVGVMLAACAEPTLTHTVIPTRSTVVSFPVSSPNPPSSSTRDVVSATPTVSTPPSTTRTATSSPAPTPTRTRAPTPTPAPATPTPTANCTETQGHVRTGTFLSTIIGQEQPYRVYLPPCYDFGDDRFPVLYMLHGYPFDDSHWDEIGIDEAADAGIANGTLPPFIIAMPAADNEGTYTNTSGGPGSFEAVMLDEFVPFIEAAYRVLDKAEGRAIGGMSRGGVWSLEIAFRNPERFAAVGGHSVALNVNRAPPVYDPLYLASDPVIRILRIYLDTGQEDWALPGMDELHAALTTAGVPHTYYVYEGYHDDSYWSAHVAEYLAFYAAEW